jgi:hypothetical protein
MTSVMTLLRLYRARHQFGKYARGRQKRSSPMMDVYPSGDELITGTASIMTETYFGLNKLEYPDLSRNRQFHSLALLTITGPHSYFIFEIFDLNDILFYYPDKTEYWDD